MANRIKQLREERGLSQEALGELANTSGQQIGLLEKGKRRLTVDWCQRLAKAMRIDDWKELTKPPVKNWKVPVSGRLVKDLQLSPGDDTGVIGDPSRPIGNGDDVEEDAFLNSIGGDMHHAEDLMAIYKKLSPAGRKRLLQEAIAISYDDLEGGHERPRKQRA